MINDLQYSWNVQFLLRRLKKLELKLKCLSQIEFHALEILAPKIKSCFFSPIDYYKIKETKIWSFYVYLEASEPKWVNPKDI